ncbi:hypothetical protein GCM10007052_19590 [Halioglobus japonicus]|nr:hypothetical protein GCM10007052_19590 [Halioglobus japonicus]
MVIHTAQVRNVFDGRSEGAIKVVPGQGWGQTPVAECHAAMVAHGGVQQDFLASGKAGLGQIPAVGGVRQYRQVHLAGELNHGHAVAPLMADVVDNQHHGGPRL